MKTAAEDKGINTTPIQSHSSFAHAFPHAGAHVQITVGNEDDVLRFIEVTGKTNRFELALGKSMNHIT